MTKKQKFTNTMISQCPYCEGNPKMTGWLSVEGKAYAVHCGCAACGPVASDVFAACKRWNDVADAAKWAKEVG